METPESPMREKITEDLKVAMKAGDRATVDALRLINAALKDKDIEARGAGKLFWSLPVVGETWDGCLNDVNGQHVTAEHAAAALAAAAGGPVPEGNVGGGTGMICHDFKGGCGTASRIADCGGKTFTVGAHVQANHGRRERFQVNGVPVGLLLGDDEVPIPVTPEERQAAGGGLTPGGDAATPRGGASTPHGAGSIIIVVATDAPLLPHQLSRLAERAGLGVVLLGACGDNYSGDLMLAFSTANRGLTSMSYGATGPVSFPVEMLSLAYIDPLFEAAVEATEEAILNARLQAETMTGRDGVTAYALDGERLVALLDRYGRRRYRD
jgi:D-aminopeptidase